MDPNAYRQFLELEETHWWFRGRRTVYFGLLESFLAGKRPARVLDLGCGYGGFLPGLARHGARVFPSDVSAESLRHCAARGFPGGVVASGYALPYRDASFDLVCLFDAIEHIPDDARVMHEVARILVPGGAVLVTVPAYQFLYANNDRIAQHQRRYTRGMLRRLFEDAGLTVRRNTHSNVLLFPLILPAVLGIKALEKLLPRKVDSDHTNLSWPLPRPLHDLLHAIFASELVVSRRFEWPAGHSIAAIAVKPAAGDGTPAREAVKKTSVASEAAQPSCPDAPSSAGSSSSSSSPLTMDSSYRTARESRSKACIASVRATDTLRLRYIS